MNVYERAPDHPKARLLLRYFIALCIKLFINFAAKVHKAAVAAETRSLLSFSSRTHLGIKDY
jgi:energy-coupling factor transporter transmembrane protein EcfT